MTERINCPVCENDIPSDARFLCPTCHFELKWLDDKAAIERSKQKFLSKIVDSSVETGQIKNGETGIKSNLGYIGLLGGTMGFIIAAIVGLIFEIFIFQLLAVLIPCFIIGQMWTKIFKNGKGCLFVLCLAIGVIAPALLIFILFPGGY